MFGGERREPERYGDVLFSVQAGSGMYSTPREDRHPWDSYEAYEVAVLRAGTGTLCRPSKLGLPDWFDAFFEPGSKPVAGYVPKDDVQRMREYLMLRCGMHIPEPVKQEPLGEWQPGQRRLLLVRR